MYITMHYYLILSSLVNILSWLHSSTSLPWPSSLTTQQLLHTCRVTYTCLEFILYLWPVNCNVGMVADWKQSCWRLVHNQLCHPYSSLLLLIASIFWISLLTTTGFSIHVAFLHSMFLLNLFFNEECILCLCHLRWVYLLCISALYPNLDPFCSACVPGHESGCLLTLLKGTDP